MLPPKSRHVTDAYAGILLRNELYRMLQNGLVTYKFPLPFLFSERERLKKDVETCAHKLGEPILFVTGDVEQLFTPYDMASFHVDCEKGENGGLWYPPISKMEKRLLKEGDVRVVGVGVFFPDEAGRFILEVACDGDISKIVEKQNRLVRSGLRIDLEPEAPYKTIFQGVVHDGANYKFVSHSANDEPENVSSPHPSL